MHRKSHQAETEHISCKSFTLAQHTSLTRSIGTIQNFQAFKYHLYSQFKPFLFGKSWIYYYEFESRKKKKKEDKLSSIIWYKE